MESVSDASISVTDTQLVGNGTDAISGFEQAALTGSSAADTFSLAFTGSVTVDGAGGNDTLIGPNVAANWDVSAQTLTTATMAASYGTSPRTPNGEGGASW